MVDNLLLRRCGLDLARCCLFRLPTPHPPYLTALSPATSQLFRSSRSVVSYTAVSCTIILAACLLSIVCFTRYYLDFSYFSTAGLMRTREYVGLAQLQFARAFLQHVTRFCLYAPDRRDPLQALPLAQLVGRGFSRLMLCL